MDPADLEAWHSRLAKHDPCAFAAALDALSRCLDVPLVLADHVAAQLDARPDAVPSPDVLARIVARSHSRTLFDRAWPAIRTAADSAPLIALLAARVPSPAIELALVERLRTPPAGDGNLHVAVITALGELGSLAVRAPLMHVLVALTGDRARHDRTAEEERVRARLVRRLAHALARIGERGQSPFVVPSSPPDGPSST